MRIRHWIPAYNLEFHGSVTTQILHDDRWAAANGHTHDVVAGHSCDLNWSRNSALHRAIDAGYDLLMMQDSDCFSQERQGALRYLAESLEATGATVVGAAVPLRIRKDRSTENEEQVAGAVQRIVDDSLKQVGVTDQARPIVVDLVAKHPLIQLMAKRIQSIPMNVSPWHPGKVFECEKIGTGIVLIDLRKIRDWYGAFDGPCFWRTYEGKGGVGKGIKQLVGQDIWFTRDVVRGIHKGKVICDGRISTTHVDRTHEIVFDAAEAATDTADTVAGTATSTAGSEAA